jgi:hypothetical protein
MELVTVRDAACDNIFKAERNITRSSHAIAAGTDGSTVNMTGTFLGMGFPIKLKFSSRSAMLMQGVLSLALEGMSWTEGFPDN